ncbi:MAG TPA: PadR family transcriptional regulator [Acidobacteriaceae bacterium]|nr:PadR family transcriptional regulator [Acidobacteriaceae bacterium]
MFGRNFRSQFEDAAQACTARKYFRGGRGGFWAEMGEHWGRHQGRHRFGREFGGRLFESGELRFVILSYIAEKPAHGYEIMKGIGEQMGGAYAPSAGVIYPTLSQLEDEGLATVVAEGGKKLYTITDTGRKELESNKQLIEGLLRRIREMGEAFGSGRAPQIMRAIHNFKMALKLRFAQGNLSPEQISKIAAIIDAAARDVESV